MDYARQQRDPTKHAIGIAFVVLVHVLLIWALLTGLGKAIVEVVKKPLTATIIEEIKLPPPPPPPPKKIIEPPKVAPPRRPTFRRRTFRCRRRRRRPSITATTAAPPAEPHVIAPPSPWRRPRRRSPRSGAGVSRALQATTRNIRARPSGQAFKRARSSRA